MRQWPLKKKVIIIIIKNACMWEEWRIMKIIIIRKKHVLHGGCTCGGWYIYIVSVVMVVVFEKYKNDRINYV